MYVEPLITDSDPSRLAAGRGQHISPPIISPYLLQGEEHPLDRLLSHRTAQARGGEQSPEGRTLARIERKVQETRRCRESAKIVWTSLVRVN